MSAVCSFFLNALANVKRATVVEDYKKGLIWASVSNFISIELQKLAICPLYKSSLLKLG